MGIRLFLFSLIFFFFFFLLILIGIIHLSFISRSSLNLFVKEENFLQYQLKDLKNVSEIRIPRLIHQTWKNEEIPLRWNLSVQSVKKLNKQFEYYLWTDQKMFEFVEKYENNFYKETFVNYNYPIQRVDSFRYILLYHIGGIYIDMDIGCSKSLNELLNVMEYLDMESKDLGALPSTRPFGLSNDFMISTKGHPLFHQLISNLNSFNHNYFIYYLTIMLSTGSLYLTINERLFNRSIKKCSLRILEEKVYSPMFLWFAGGNTWHGKDARIIKGIYQCFRGDQLCLLLFFILFLIIIICFRIRRSSFFQFQLNKFQTNLQQFFYFLSKKILLRKKKFFS